MNPISETNLLVRINEIKSKINQTKIASKRNDEILLLAVTKKQPIERIKEAYELGLSAFAENYLQEALPKIQALPKTIDWHFIGHIQSNKTKLIAQYFNWVHTIDRIKIIEKLANERLSILTPINICLEINLNNEASKTGFKLNEIELINHCIDLIKTLPSLTLRGLMCMPELTHDKIKQRHHFLQLKNLQARLNQFHQINMDTLSMGTSIDYESAILEGSHIIRIGTALFGQRK